jgi:hypothetical protein
MTGILITAIALLVYASPIALLVAWISGLRRDRSISGPRSLCGWTSLLLVSVAVFLCWAAPTPSVASPEWGVYLRKWFRITTAIALVGFLIGIFGQGKRRWMVLSSAVSVPLFWFLALVLE